MSRLYALVAVAVIAACSPQQRTAGPDTGTESGICYETSACQGERDSWLGLSQSRCRAFGARSWRGDHSGCVTF